MVADGSLRGAESSFNGIRSLSGTPTATGDVVLYPKFQVLAAEDAAFSRLSDAQQAIVRGAAVAARDLAVAKHVPDAQLASEWCALHGRVVLAGADGVRSFQEAAAPVLATLAQDPVTATALDAITRLKAGLTTTSPAVQACEPAADPNAPWPSVAPGPDLGLHPRWRLHPHRYRAGAQRGRRRSGGRGAQCRERGGCRSTASTARGRTCRTATRPAILVPLDFQLHGDRVRMQQHDHPSFWEVRWSSKDDVLQLEIVGSDWSTAQGAVSLNAYWKGSVDQGGVTAAPLPATRRASSDTGRVTTRRVPAPGGESSSSCPSIETIRSRRPRRPVPASRLAPPTPASSTRSVTSYGSAARLIATDPAPACRAAFATASAHTKYRQAATSTSSSSGSPGTSRSTGIGALSAMTTQRRDEACRPKRRRVDPAEESFDIVPGDVHPAGCCAQSIVDGAVGSARRGPADRAREVLEAASDIDVHLARELLLFPEAGVHEAAAGHGDPPGLPFEVVAQAGTLWATSSTAVSTAERAPGLVERRLVVHDPGELDRRRA